MKTINKYTILIIFLIISTNLIKCDMDFNKVKKNKKNNKQNNNLINKKAKRKLDEIPDLSGLEYEDLKIHFDFYNFDYTIPTDLANYKTLFINAINKSANILQSILKICKTSQNLIMPEMAFKTYKIEKYDTELFTSSPQYDFNFGVFFRFADDIDKKLAIPEIMVTDDYYDIPRFGLINLNNDISVYKLTSNFLNALMLHELTHLIGFMKDNIYFNNLIQDENESGVVHYYIKSTNVFNYAKKYFNCDSFKGVEIDIDGDIPHWSSRYLLGEYMTEFVYTEEQVISNFTLSLFKDLGYLQLKDPYKYTGGLMRFGKHKGCDFLDKKCIGDGKQFENEFYYPINDNINGEYEEPSCSSGRLSKTIHKLYLYSDSITKYFPGTFYGGLPQANYCPVSHYASSEILKIGLCSEKDSTSNIDLGESFSENSLCALSSFVKKNNPNYQLYTDKFSAVCFKMFCSEESLTIQVGEDFFVCPREGGKIESEEYFYGYLLCPDYNLICTAKVVCNNMFDCFTKNLEEKGNTYDYNYDSKTTQVLSSYATVARSYGYELTTNGICHKYCSHCDKNKKCLKCPPNYKLENNECIEKISNCATYNNDEICTECKENYVLIKEDENLFNCLLESSKGSQYFSETNNGITYYIKCSKKLENCFSCDSSTVCSNCDNNYGLVDGNCVDLSSKKYYFDTNDSKYKLCSSKLDGCETCTKDSKGEIYCIQCISTYAIVYGNPDKCVLESTIENDDSLFKDKDGKYYSCSDSKYHSVEKCLNCKNKDYCELCQNDYSLFNSKKLCLSDSDINEKKYYLDPTDNNYYLCSKKIQGCNKCEDGNTCIECNSDYGLDENNKCVLLSIAITKYYLDPITGKYVSCNKIENCDECSSASQCSKCQDGYKLNNNICEIIIENGGNYKVLAIVAIILSCIAILGVIAILLLLIKKGIFKAKSNKTDTSIIINKENDDDILSKKDEVNLNNKKRSIHNTVKVNNE